MSSSPDWEHRLTSIRNGTPCFLTRCPAGLLLKATHLGLVFLVTVTVVGFFSVMEVDPHHDGIMLKPAVDVSNGRMLFRDSFSQYGALTILIQALAIEIFGEKLIAIRLLTAFFYGLIAVLQWLIYSRLLPIWANAISWAIWLSLGYFFLDYEALTLFPSPTVFAVTSVLLSVYLLILYLEYHKQPYMWLCGMAVACTFWFKINYGIIHFGSMALLLTLLEASGTDKNHFRNVRGFIAGYLVVHVIFLLWLLTCQSLKDFWIQSVEFGYLFAAINQFSTGGPFLKELIACLFQVDSKHCGTSGLWTFLPIVSVMVCGRSYYSLARKRTIGLPDKIVLATSLVSAGLWFAYFPICSVYHMYLSSALSFGVVVYAIWGGTRSFPLHWRYVVSILCVILIFEPDILRRLSGCVRQVTEFSTYRKIETPSFLRGMYVPPREAGIYSRFESIIKDYGEYGLLNLTRDALYSLYDVNDGFHKMHVNWGWINSVLYRGYLARLKEVIAAKSHIIMSNDSFCIEGYVPLAVFPEMGKGELKSKVILHIPGESRDAFEVVRIGRAVESPFFSLRSKFPLIQLASVSEEPVFINSLVVRVYTPDLVCRIVNRNEFEYDVLARAMNRESEEVLKEWYRFDEGLKKYVPPANPDSRRTAEILDAVSGLFLCERYSNVVNSLTDWWRHIAVFWKGKPVIREEGDLGELVSVQCSKNDAIEIVPFVRLPESYIMKVRINFNVNQYYETTIYSSSQEGL